MPDPAVGSAGDGNAEVVEIVFDGLRQISPDPQALSERLRARLALPAGEADRLLYETIARIHLQLFPPITQVELILTEACNLRCRYCFETTMLGSRSMAAETGRRAVDLLVRYSANEPRLSVTFFGGEPILRLSTMEEIARYARRRAAVGGKEVDFNTTTNGTLITDRVAEVLAEQRIKALLSLDGLDTSHDRFRVDRRGRGSFAAVVRGLRRLKAVQPWIAAKMTVMPENVSRLCEDVRGLHDLGVNQFIIGHATGVRWDQPDMDAFAAQWRDLCRWYRDHRNADLLIEDLEKEESPGSYFGCQAGRTGISVSVDGDVSPCSKLLALDKTRALGRLGDLRHGLTHLTNRFEVVGAEGVRAAWTAVGSEIPYRGGCFAENFEENGALFQPSLQEHRFSALRAEASSRA